jgi:hypothetical protein
MTRLKKGVDVTGDPAQWSDEDRILYTFDEAMAMLPDGDFVNVKVNNAPGLIVGADWTKDALREALAKAYLIEESGSTAARMGFGLYFLAEGGNRYFVETRSKQGAEA